MAQAVVTRNRVAGKEPHAGISSSDPIYKSLETEIKKSKLQDIVDVLGRGKGSNVVRFGLVVAAEALAMGHIVVLKDSELTLEEPKPAEKPVAEPK